jgi:hypothetical protein
MNKTAAILEMPLGLAKVELGKMFRSPHKEVVDYSVMPRGKHAPSNSISSTIIGSLRMHRRGRSQAPKATSRFGAEHLRRGGQRWIKNNKDMRNTSTRHVGGLGPAGFGRISLRSPTR